MLNFATQIAREAGKLLVQRLGVAKVTTKGDINLVTARLRDHSADLAVLLRELEAWVVEESLFAIRFEVDGREYVLQAGEADWQSAPQAHCA